MVMDSMKTHLCEMNTTRSSRTQIEQCESNKCTVGTFVPHEAARPLNAPRGCTIL